MSAGDKDVGGVVGADADASALGLVDSSRTTDLSGIRVFDVGQGDCIGLLDQSNDVFCYVDYGGLSGHPDRANPSNTAIRLPVTVNGHSVPIVLTHWDKDHYYSAVKKNTAAQSCEWVVPRQLASPQAVLFAAKLSNAKCWPETAGNAIATVAIGQRELQIRKCKKFSPTAASENRNHSGLAVTLQDNGVTPPRLMLLAGDCHFDGIPNIPSGELHVLVAYHHGSHADWSTATTRTIATTTSSCELAYSYGPNPYGHPDRSNYKPTWDASAVTTEEMRESGQKSEDFYW